MGFDLETIFNLGRVDEANSGKEQVTSIDIAFIIMIKRKINDKINTLLPASLALIGISTLVAIILIILHSYLPAWFIITVVFIFVALYVIGLITLIHAVLLNRDLKSIREIDRELRTQICKSKEE